MVSPRYMLDRPAAPGTLVRTIHQVAIPLAIDVAASVEAVLEQVATVARRRPWSAVLGAMLLGGLVGAWSAQAARRR